jgi:polyphosphate kinase
MPRNLFERCEVVFPIRDAQIRNRIRNEILGAYLADTAKSRIETAAGDYPRVRAPEGRGFNAQDFLIRVAEGRDSVDGIPEPAWQPEVVALAPESVKNSAAPPKRRRRKPAAEKPQAEPTEAVDTGETQSSKPAGSI